MKKILAVLMAAVLVVGLVGCGGKDAQDTGKTVMYEDDVDGYWYNSKTNSIMGLKYGDYILCLMDTLFTVEGTYYVDNGTITIYPDGVDSTLVYSSAKVRGDIMTAKTEDGDEIMWKNISEDEVRKRLETAEANN